MKKIILAGMVALFCTFTKAQLTNTNWLAYDSTNTAGLYWSFGTDTMKFSLNDTNYYLSSTYYVNGFTFYIIDQNGACGPDTGTYTFFIQNDTLTFTLINDQCTDRVEYLTSTYFVNNTTGIINNNPLLFSLSPNPTTGNFTITFTSTISKGTIEVYNTIGAKLISQNILNANSANIQLNNFAKGIYFVLMNDGEKQFCKKITKY